MTAWKAYRACHSTPTDVFYDEHRIPEAARICATCPVRDACLDAEMGEVHKASQIQGWRAGLPEQQRRRIWSDRYPDARARAIEAGAYYYDLIPA